MSAPTFNGHGSFVSASKLVEAIAADLTQIKAEEGLTDAELGEALGVGDDQAAKYRTGLATMNAVAFIRGCQHWNGRFANSALAKIGQKVVGIGSSKATDRHGLTALTKLMLEVSIALEDDEQVDDLELARMKKQLEDAGSYVDKMRHRLAERAA
jgi:hypothetical protein